MGFKFKSLHISAFAVIVAIILGLAYMLYRRYSNSKEGFDNVKTRIVTEEEWRRLYPKDTSLTDMASEFFSE